MIYITRINTYISFQDIITICEYKNNSNTNYKIAKDAKPERIFPDDGPKPIAFNLS
jgi:hypothetical protein